MDAILAFDADGKPFEPEWPAADVIIGNPPFLGGNKMRAELGDEYVDDFIAIYMKIVFQHLLIWFVIGLKKHAQ